ncbi:RIP metalloprotease RseP [Blattabacterium cuenoti]|uniref:RIP metalloprotease RseP n=1 Tax=Blattabacterium cuenoti TaxID=1653831 RepID=UPI00163B6A48|nr:RIP metalloprotease RseP [Blattabacterium cuenoti]
MTSFFIKSIQLLFSISILIFFHELGHFFLAKLFKVRVERFFLFFDPWFSLFKKKIGDTIYGIGWLPFGGYVKISGMVNNEKKDKLITENTCKFYSQTSIRRLLIISGGIIFNAILSILIFTFLLFKYGEINIPIENAKYGIETDALGKEIGLKNGDVILSINGKKIKYFNEIPQEIFIGNIIIVNRMGKIMKLYLNNSKKSLIFDRKYTTLPIKPRIPSVISYIFKNSIAEKYKLKIDDEILSVDTGEILFYDQIKEALFRQRNETFLISINRDGDFMQKKIHMNSKGILGVCLKTFMDLDDIFFFERKHYSIFDSIYHGFMKTWYVLKNQILFFKNVFHIETKAYKQVGSFFSIAKEFPSKWNWEIFWNFTATLSIWLAFINLFPIPSLDGGYIFFIIIEMLIGKKLNEKFIERCTILGFLLVSFMMLSIIIWDIFKVFIY